MTPRDPAQLVPADVLNTSLTELLDARPDCPDPAFTWQVHAGDSVTEHTLTWADLLRRVRSVAGRLEALTEPGDRVAVLSPQNLDYVVGFLAALYAGRVAVPLPAPQGRAQIERLTGALTDSAARVWLTSSGTVDAVRALVDADVPGPSGILEVDTVPSLARESRRAAAPVDGGDVAYLQYTSGSTRRPAGAMITHRAIAANCWQSAQAYDVDSATTFTGWLPFFHDMGLMLLIAMPVFTGGHSVFTAPLEFIRRPQRWLRSLQLPNALTAAPNFAYDLAVDVVRAGRTGRLDLSGVRATLNGSEPVRPATVRAFTEALRPFGFPPEAHRPCYGLAEATVYVSGTGRDGPVFAVFDRAALAAGRLLPAKADVGGVELVAAGRSHGQLVRVVDPESAAVVADGVVGEVWVWGPHVAAGYWNRPVETAATFDGRLAEPDPGLPATGWLRTGDLGARHDGLLYLTGRAKDLIIIDGRNHYPHDIEHTVADSHDVLRRDRVAVVAGRDADGETVVVVAERHGRPLDEQQTRDVTRAVRRAIATRHDVALGALHLVKPGALPRTSSGKIARSAVRDRWAGDAPAG
ncbi:fatty acyl-AMP ligase [Amycolatopsis suaedae]|uniref:Fatty acyl-AMP ligase n=1 Tax=Amycolatopsis suaedae TaxID=2510978 RepID=A0A4Q7JAJ8_9PSEU|nr:fatty acyl-AMP ligase [Amycolatopsis suaedae]RZQ64078.1 fatty acyl-AMP ligase [Amycolatopsis suaedae]